MALTEWWWNYSVFIFLVARSSVYKCRFWTLDVIFLFENLTGKYLVWPLSRTQPFSLDACTKKGVLGKFSSSTHSVRWSYPRCPEPWESSEEFPALPPVLPLPQLQTSTSASAGEPEKQNTYSSLNYRFGLTLAFASLFSTLTQLSNSSPIWSL